MNADTIVITGATSGIGLETARLLAGEGFRILGVGRSEERCAAAQREILSSVPGGSVSVGFITADLMQRREVLGAGDRIAAELEQNGGGLYALINNAGCARSWYMTTEDGCEQQFALNYLAGYMLTHRLLDHLLKCGGRVIMTGSGSHIGAKVHWDDVMLSRRYNPLTAYKQSKLCDILFARGLADRYGADGLHAYTVDPGLVNTDIGNKTGGIVSLVWGIRKHQGVHPSVPAKTYSFLCARDKTPPGGLYYYMCRERRYSREVTSENADRLFALSEKLCGLGYRSECIHREARS